MSESPESSSKLSCSSFCFCVLMISIGLGIMVCIPFLIYDAIEYGKRTSPEESVDMRYINGEINRLAKKQLSEECLAVNQKRRDAQATHDRAELVKDIAIKVEYEKAEEIEELERKAKKLNTLRKYF